MKCVIFLISAALLKVACTAEIHNDIKRTERDDKNTQQPLINLQNIKNNTKEAAHRILNLLKPEVTTERPIIEEPKKNSFINHHFDKDNQFKPFSNHHNRPSFEKSEILSDTPLCICNNDQIPTFPSFTTTPNFKGPAYLPTPPTTRDSFNSRRIPTFEPIPSRDYYSNSIETPVINHYSPLEFSSLYTFDSNDFK